MGTKPRTPEQYPRMKQRGVRRRNNLRSTQQVTARRYIMTMDWGMVGEFFASTARAVGNAFSSLAAAFKAPARPDDYALTAPEEGQS